MDPPPPTPPADPGSELVDAPEDPRPSRPVRYLVIAIAALALVAGWVATALTPVLATQHPVLLLALESPVRNLLLTREVDLPLYLGVAVVRRVSSATAYFLLGRWYGEHALAWLANRGGRSGRAVRRAARIVHSAAVPAVMLVPGAAVCVAAGATRMRPATFVAASIVGSTAVTLVVRRVGYALAAPLDRVLALFRAHLTALTLIALAVAAAVGLSHLHGAHKRRAAATDDG